MSFKNDYLEEEQYPFIYVVSIHNVYELNERHVRVSLATARVTRTELGCISRKKRLIRIRNAFSFANCELRSMVIVDKSLIFTSFIVYFFPCSGFFESTCVRSTSMLGTGTSTTDYPGRIPPGRDIQSATVDEKLANDMFVSGFT
ncbi:hypothetical protein Tco_0285704 [Tanacetum coccineum]